METLPLAAVRASPTVSPPSSTRGWLDQYTQLSKYVEQVVSTHERVTITRNGRPSAVLISAEDLEAMQGTHEVLGDLQEREQEAGSARR